VKDIDHLLGAETMVMTVQNGLPWWYFQKLGGKYDNKKLVSLDPAGTLAEKIGAERVLLGARVRGMRPSEGTQIGAYTLRIQRGGENYELGADVVVLATSAYRAAELAQTLSLTLERELAAVEYPPLAGICVAYKKGAVPHPLQGFGFLVPRDEGVRLLGCIWSSSLFPGRAP